MTALLLPIAAALAAVLLAGLLFAALYRVLEWWRPRGW